MYPESIKQRIEDLKADASKFSNDAAFQMGMLQGRIAELETILQQLLDKQKEKPNVTTTRRLHNGSKDGQPSSVGRDKQTG